jgi:hypothetical protein
VRDPGGMLGSLIGRPPGPSRRSFPGIEVLVPVPVRLRVPMPPNEIRAAA